MSTGPKSALSVNEAEQRLQAVISKAPLVFFALDASGTFTLSEGRALQKLGLQPGEVVGRSIFELYADKPKILADARRALRGEEFYVVAEIPELQLYFETYWAPIRNGNGEVLGTIGV